MVDTVYPMLAPTQLCRGIVLLLTPYSYRWYIVSTLLVWYGVHTLTSNGMIRESILLMCFQQGECGKKVGLVMESLFHRDADYDCDATVAI